MKSSVNICNGRCHDELLWWPLLGRWHCHRFVCDYGRHPSLPQKDCNPAGCRNDIPRTAGDSQATLQKTAEWTCCLAHPAATTDRHLGLSIAWGRNACVVGRGCPLACHELLEGEARMWIVCGHLPIPTAKDFCFFFFWVPITKESPPSPLCGKLSWWWVTSIFCHFLKFLPAAYRHCPGLIRVEPWPARTNPGSYFRGTEWQ